MTGFNVLRVDCPAEAEDGASCAGLWVYRVAMLPNGDLEPVELLRRTCAEAHAVSEELTNEQDVEASWQCLAGVFVDWEQAPALTGARS